MLRRRRHAQLRQEDDDVLLRKQRSAKRRLAHGGGQLQVGGGGRAAEGAGDRSGTVVQPVSARSAEGGVPKQQGAHLAFGRAGNRLLRWEAGGTLAY